jgi:hypothetical protein
MAFRNAATVVVARIFKLLDNNGFLRLFFGPFLFQGIEDGYALRYEDPNWTDPDVESGVFFGESNSPNQASAKLYAIGDQGTTLTLAGVSASATYIPGTPTRNVGATMFADDDTGGIQREVSVGVIAQSLPIEDVEMLLNCTRSPNFCQIDLKTDATRGEILIVADRMGAWTAVPGGAAFGNFGGAFQTCQYRKVGDIVQLRGEAVTTAPTGANPIVCTLPAGFRPPATVQIPVEFAGAFGYVAVNAAGQVNLITPGVGAGFTVSLMLTFYTSA